MLMSLLPEIIAGIAIASSGGLVVAKKDVILDKFKNMRIPIEFETQETEMTANDWISLYVRNHHNLKRTLNMSIERTHVLTHYKKKPITFEEYMKVFEQWDTLVEKNYDFIENNNRHFFSVFIPETVDFFSSFNSAYMSGHPIKQAPAQNRYVYIPGNPSNPNGHTLDAKQVRTLIYQYQKIFGMMYHFHKQHIEMVEDRNRNSLDQISVSMENTFAYVASNGDMYGYEIEDGLFEEVPILEEPEEVELEETPTTPSQTLPVQTDDFIEQHGKVLESEMDFYKGKYQYSGVSFDLNSRSHYIITGDFDPDYLGSSNKTYPQLKNVRRMHVMTDSLSKPGDARPYKMVTINNYQPSKVQIHDPEFFFHYVKDKLPSNISTYDGPAHLRHIHDAKYIVFFRDSLFYGNFEQIAEMLEIYFLNPKYENFKDLPARELKFLNKQMANPSNHIFYLSN